MNTKTIAVENRVYEKLAKRKKPGESFTKVIDRMVDAEAGRDTCADALRHAAEVWSRKPPPADAMVMESVVKSNRSRADWSVEKPE